MLLSGFLPRWCDTSSQELPWGGWKSLTGGSSAGDPDLTRGLVPAAAAAGPRTAAGFPDLGLCSGLLSKNSQRWISNPAPDHPAAPLGQRAATKGGVAGTPVFTGILRRAKEQKGKRYGAASGKTDEQTCAADSARLSYILFAFCSHQQGFRC